MLIFWNSLHTPSLKDGCDFVCRSRNREEPPAYRGVATEPLEEEPEERDDHLLPMWPQYVRNGTSFFTVWHSLRFHRFDEIAVRHKSVFLCWFRLVPSATTVWSACNWDRPVSSPTPCMSFMCLMANKWVIHLAFQTTDFSSTEIWHIREKLRYRVSTWWKLF